MKHDGGWKRLGSRQLFESRWFRLRQDQVQLPDESLTTYTVIENPGYVVIVPVLDDSRVILEHVYRYTLQETSTEVPSGGLDGESPEVAARRELEEETGWVARDFTLLGTFSNSTGISDERFHVMLARGLTQTGTISREPTEQIELELLPFETALERVHAGRLTHAPSALAILLAAERIARSR